MTIEPTDPSGDPEADGGADDEDVLGTNAPAPSEVQVQGSPGVGHGNAHAGR